VGHVAAPELTSARRRDPELRDTWRCRSSPQQGGDVRGRGTRGSSGAHLCREVWSEATTYVTAHGCTPCSLSLLKAFMLGCPVFRVPTMLISLHSCLDSTHINCSAATRVVFNFLNQLNLLYIYNIF
jgi:hypothetical protein